MATANGNGKKQKSLDDLNDDLLEVNKEMALAKAYDPSIDVTSIAPTTVYSTDEVLNGLAELNAILVQAETVVEAREQESILAETEAKELKAIKHDLKVKVNTLAVKHRQAQIRSAFADRVKAQEYQDIDKLKRVARSLKKD